MALSRGSEFVFTRGVNSPTDRHAARISVSMPEPPSPSAHDDPGASVLRPTPAAGRDHSRTQTLLTAAGLCIAAVVVAVGGAMLGQIVIAPRAMGSIAAALNGLGGSPLLNTIYLVIGFLPVYLGLLLLIRVVDRSWSGDLLARGRAPALWLVGIVLGSAMICLPCFVAVMMGGARIEFAVLDASGLYAAGLALFAWSFQAFAEEFVFRGWLQPKLSMKFGPVAAIVV